MALIIIAGIVPVGCIVHNGESGYQIFQGHIIILIVPLMANSGRMWIVTHNRRNIVAATEFNLIVLDQLKIIENGLDEKWILHETVAISHDDL